MSFGGGSASDPYQLFNVIIALNGLDYGRGYSDVSNKVQVDPRLVAGQTTAVILSIGQSTSANGTNTAYTPTSDKAENLCIQNGGLYKAFDPLLGCDGLVGTWQSRLADKLILGGIKSRVILEPIAISGTSAFEWAAGGVANHRIGVAARRAASVGLTITHVIYMQGETDTQIGTTKASYKASLASTIDTIRSVGISAPIAIGKCSWISGAPSATIQAAQMETVNNSLGIYAGADTDSLNNSYRYDTTHFNAAGADAVAGLWTTIIAGL